jgi:tRNA dimethylallyltransferase
MSACLIVVAGPTAVGKSKLAVQLAEKFQTVVVNADSRQVYREMSIGTAVPSTDEQKGIPHYLLGHISIHAPYHASHYETDAIELLSDLFKQYEVVILTGGSGLYIDAVCKGIDDIPSVTKDVRTGLNAEYLQVGIQGIRNKLMSVDPAYYQRVDLNNPQRILKALEVYAASGVPYSEFLTGKAKIRDFSIIKIGLNIPREQLHAAINARVELMIHRGLLEEARTLYPFRTLNALNTVGYKELFAAFDKEISVQEAVEQIKGHTRQYARRQLTWFHRDKECQWFHPQDTEQIMNYVTHKILENESA